MSKKKKKKPKHKKVLNKINNLGEKFDVSKTITDVSALPIENPFDLDFEKIVQLNIKYRKYLEKMIQMIKSNNIDQDFISDLVSLLHL